jgi:hypothetical protein
MGGEERRQHPRARCDVRVRILTPKSGSAICKDISQSGMLLEMQRPPLIPEGKEIQVQFQLDRKQRPIGARAEVMRHASRTAMGIRFLMLDIDEMQAIAAYVAAGEPA